MSQRASDLRKPRATPNAYAGPTACLRCDDTFESWDRRQNRLCPKCRVAIAAGPVMRHATDGISAPGKMGMTAESARQSLSGLHSLGGLWGLRTNPPAHGIAIGDPLLRRHDEAARLLRHHTGAAFHTGDETRTGAPHFRHGSLHFPGHTFSNVT